MAWANEGSPDMCVLAGKVRLPEIRILLQLTRGSLARRNGGRNLSETRAASVESRCLRVRTQVQRSFNAGAGQSTVVEPASAALGAWFRNFLHEISPYWRGHVCTRERRQPVSVDRHWNPRCLLSRLQLRCWRVGGLDPTLARIRLLVTERPTFRHSCAIYEPAAPSKGQSMGYCCPKNDYFGMIDAKLNKSSYRNGNSGAR